MRLEPGYLFGMALQTVPEPRKVARELFDYGAPRHALWTLLALLIVLTTSVSVVGGIIAPADPATYGPVLSSPMTLGVLEAVFLGALVWAVFLIGRRFGGQGTLDEAIITVVWMELILFGLQLVSLVLILFAPGLAAMTLLLTIFMFFWVLSQFAAESHGFSSVGLVFTTILLTLILMVVLLSIVLAMMGFQPIDLPVEPPK